MQGRYGHTKAATRRGQIGTLREQGNRVGEGELKLGFQSELELERVLLPKWASDWLRRSRV